MLSWDATKDIAQTTELNSMCPARDVPCMWTLTTKSHLQNPSVLMMAHSTVMHQENILQWFWRGFNLRDAFCACLVLISKIRLGAWIRHVQVCGHEPRLHWSICKMFLLLCKWKITEFHRIFVSFAILKCKSIKSRKLIWQHKNGGPCVFNMVRAPLECFLSFVLFRFFFFFFPFSLFFDQDSL